MEAGIYLGRASQGTSRDSLEALACHAGASEKYSHPKVLQEFNDDYHNQERPIALLL